MIEPKVGDIITVGGIKYRTELSPDPNKRCEKCHLLNVQCLHIACTAYCRNDNQAVIFKKVKEMEVKIQIPDNCELIKDGDTYIVKEKKQEPPRSWKEFCERYPVQDGEYFITLNSSIVGKTDCVCDSDRDPIQGKNWCISREEAEAFRALMQLRQLRKAWVGNWTPNEGEQYAIVLVATRTNNLKSRYGYSDYNHMFSFPTKEMADEFISCFSDLCKTAKILL